MSTFDVQKIDWLLNAKTQPKIWYNNCLKCFINEIIGTVLIYKHIWIKYYNSRGGIQEGLVLILSDS